MPDIVPAPSVSVFASTMFRFLTLVSVTVPIKSFPLESRAKSAPDPTSIVAVPVTVRANPPWLRLPPIPKYMAPATEMSVDCVTTARASRLK